MFAYNVISVTTNNLPILAVFVVAFVASPIETF
jgi:hypothetical protein